jgi:hypothetical protein
LILDYLYLLFKHSFFHFLKGEGIEFLSDDIKLPLEGGRMILFEGLVMSIVQLDQVK